MAIARLKLALADTPISAITYTRHLNRPGAYDVHWGAWGNVGWVCHLLPRDWHAFPESGGRLPTWPGGYRTREGAARALVRVAQEYNWNH
jgi:hypothetical protein